ncbi:MAG: hypothetical protein JNM76_06580 [Betaproteobacteria bacterium]|nr:hypothetical protein [Betaproteobacteria bacterium]
MHLILQLPDSVPGSTPLGACRWWLLDRSGALLREGTSAPTEAPKGERVTVTIPANRVLFTELKLPPVSAARLATLLPFAIEDKLMSDPVTILALAGPASASGERTVAVVDKPWLLQSLSALKAVGLNPDAVVPQSELVPRTAGAWSALLPPGGREGVLVREDGFALAFDVSSDPTPPLAVVLAVKEAGDKAPKSILALAASEAEVSGWSAALNLPVTWRAPALRVDQKSSFDFLDHDALRIFAKRSDWETLWPVFKPAAVVAGLIVLFHFASLGVSVWQLNRQDAAVRKEMVATFQSAFPDAKAIVDPALQMSRNLADLRRERGQATDPVVPGLAAMQGWARAAGGEVRRVQFDGRKLVAEIAFASGAPSAPAPAGLTWAANADGKSGQLSWEAAK